MKPGRKSEDNPVNIAFSKFYERARRRDPKMNEFVALGVYESGWKAGRQHAAVLARRRKKK